jgi:hypothetical protein
LASTSDRRALLKALALAPIAALASPAQARDYTSAAEVFAEIARLDASVSARLGAFAAAVPSAAGLVRSFQADHARHRVERERQLRRLGLRAGASPPAGEADASFEGLQTELEALVYAHAEGVAALGDAVAVDALARHMIDLSRQLTVLRLWQDQEDARG